MDIPSPESLKDLTREELIGLSARLMTYVLALQEQLADAHALIKQLRSEWDEWKRPATNSGNSSQPPARDWKSNRATPVRRKKRGAKRGHVKADRPLRDHPDRVIEIQPTPCGDGGTDLRAIAPRRTLRRQVTELPEIVPVVIETRQAEVVCPLCGRLQPGTLPEGLEATRQFGPRLEAVVTYFHQEHPLGLERLQTVWAEVLGVTLSEGGAVALLERAGTAAQPEAERMGESVRPSPVMGSDETSARVNGHHGWEWVLVSPAGESHGSEPSRGTDVVEAFMAGHTADVWQSDCWKPQLKAPTKSHPLGLPHQIRNLQGLIDRRPRLLWAQERQALFRAAIHLHHRRDALTPLGCRRPSTVMEKRLDRLLRRPVTGRLAQNLRERYRTHRARLLLFLHRTDVSPDNHACERAWRPSVIHRKVLGSFRSEWGPQAYAALASVLNTAKRSGVNVFQKLVTLMGDPVLPYLAAPIS